MKHILAAGAMLLSVSVAGAESSPPRPDSERASDLVRELGDSRFKVRDAAARELKKLGRLAKAALLEGVKSSDPEIWNRCSQLLPDAMALDLKARIDAFLADTEGKQKHDLPMMEQYLKIVGGEAPARKLYAEMVKQNGGFLEKCQHNPKLAGGKYIARAQEIQQQILGPWQGVQPRPQLNPADVAALFLVGADKEMSKSIPNNNANPVSNFLWQQQFQNAIRSGDQATSFRKLFFAWAENRTDFGSVSQALSVIQNLSLKEGLDFAAKVMKSKEQQIWIRAQAITVVGKLGGKDQVPSMTALFDDKTQVTTIQWNNITINTQVNDIALAMAVHLTAQSHKEYGFDALETQPGLLWAYHYLGFSSDDKRAAAYKKWNGWSEAQKKNK